jgi:hypothetical protein
MKIAKPRQPRILTVLWVVAIALVFAAAPFFSHRQDPWRGGELVLDWLVVLVPLLLIAFSILNPRAGNGVFVGSWICLGFASWDIVGHFPGSWVTGLVALVLWAWAVASLSYFSFMAYRK